MFKSIRNQLLMAAALLLTAFPAISYAQAQPTTKPSATRPAAATSKIDINTATIDQLKASPGIGDAYSRRIVDGRPYANKSQLLSKGILPAATYNKIKDQIIATQPKK
jgi:DNA uptake protein ComE-like DNA-binding protein